VSAQNQAPVSLTIEDTRDLSSAWLAEFWARHGAPTHG
jgi:hypothetical protein